MSADAQGPTADSRPDDAMVEAFAELVWNRGRSFAADDEGAVPETVAFWKDVPSVLKEEVFRPQARRDLLRLLTLGGYKCAYCGNGPCPHPDVENSALGLKGCSGPHAKAARGVRLGAPDVLREWGVVGDGAGNYGVTGDCIRAAMFSTKADAETALALVRAALAGRTPGDAP